MGSDEGLGVIRKLIRQAIRNGVLVVRLAREVLLNYPLGFQKVQPAYLLNCNIVVALVEQLLSFSQ
jgi:hypothetical protein